MSAKEYFSVGKDLHTIENYSSDLTPSYLTPSPFYATGERRKQVFLHQWPGAVSFTTLTDGCDVQALALQLRFRWREGREAALHSCVS